MTIRFREEHLRCFSAASLDFNPLHLSERYARKTSSGERVVYGMLGFLACLREIRPPAEETPAALRVDFRSPLLLDVDYTVTVEQKAASVVRVALMDGVAIKMQASVEFRAGDPACFDLPERGVAPRQESRMLQEPDFETLPSFSGPYSPGRADYEELLKLLAIDRRAWGDALPVAALGSSYATGMELPGESATYSGLRLKILTAQSRPPFKFEIALATHDTRFGLTKSKFALSDAAGIWASGEISAIARPPRRKLVVPAGGSGRFVGKTALIIGVSRGLGAAMALDLVAGGGAVVGVYAQSHDDADELLAASRGLPGSLMFECGDASDRTWCAGLKDRFKSKHGALDLLICNAAPAIQPLGVNEACFDRIEAYLAKGFALVGAPLTHFLELVSASAGSVLLISSSAVQGPPEAWPHYVALKMAAEGLMRAASAANPKVTFWIARPGRMLTDLTDTPMGRLDAEPPEAVAGKILERVCQKVPPGGVQFCD